MKESGVLQVPLGPIKGSIAIATQILGMVELITYRVIGLPTVY